MFMYLIISFVLLIFTGSCAIPAHPFSLFVTLPHPLSYDSHRHNLNLADQPATAAVYCSIWPPRIITAVIGIRTHSFFFFFPE